MARPSKIFRVLCNGNFVAQGTMKELAAETGFSQGTLAYYRKVANKNRGHITSVCLGGGEYALYKGDELLISGPIAEVAAFHGVKENTIRHYAKAANQRRRAAEKREYCVEEVEV